MEKRLFRRIVILLIISIFSTRRCQATCRKMDKAIELHVDGYKSHIIHTNTCVEIAKAIIEPDILVDTGVQFQHFRKVYVSGCCCEVKLSTLEMVTLERHDGLNFREAYYHHIHECGCGPCPSSQLSETV